MSAEREYNLETFVTYHRVEKSPTLSEIAAANISVRLHATHVRDSFARARARQ